MSRTLIALVLFLVGPALVAAVTLTPTVPPRTGLVSQIDCVGLAPPDPASPTVLGPRLLITDPNGHTSHRRAFAWQPPIRDASGAVRGFGPPQWRVRHTFRTPGTHLLALSDAANPAELHTIVPLEVRAGPASAGVIRRHPSNPLLLATADGSPLILLGCNLAWATGDQRLATWTTMLDHLASNGGNHVRVWLASWYGQADLPDGWQTREAWLMDETLAAARRRNVHVTLVLDNAHDVTHGGVATDRDGLVGTRARAFLNPDLDRHWRRRSAYALARWGADDTLLAWELVNEIDLIAHVPGGPEHGAAVASAWLSAAAAWFRERDTDRRLLASSVSGGLTSFNREWQAVTQHPAIDLIDQHVYILLPDQRSLNQHDGVGLMIEQLGSMRGHMRPWRFSEVGHQGTNEDNPGNAGDPDGLLLRQQLWAGLLLGGRGSGMAWWWDVYIERQDLWPLFAPLRQAIDAIDWSDGRLQPITPTSGGSIRVLGWLAPDQALLWPQVRADTWHRLLVEGQPPHDYGERGPNLRIGGFTPRAAFVITGIDMRTGAERLRVSVTSSARGEMLVALPGQPHDLALIIRRQR